jgi:hypothetical protein
MTKQYYKLEFKEREDANGTIEKWVEYHSGTDHDDVQFMRSLNSAICVVGETTVTPYRVAEWMGNVMMEASVFKMTRIS